MDDPLRPKTVPLAAETILWFEFLLDPKLLSTHLKKTNPNPTAIDLIQQFIQMAPDNQPVQLQFDLSTPTNENAEPQLINAVAGTTGAAQSTDVGLKIPKKAMALKILSLKVATHLKWNLDELEKNLPMQKQIFLLRDLCTIAFGKIVNVPLSADFSTKTTPEGSEKAVKFALTLYHRWVLRLQILKDIAKTSRPILHNLLLPNEPLHVYAPDIPTQQSIDYLKEMCQSTEPFYVFTYDTFIPLQANSDRTNQNFDAMKEISKAELLAQIYFDLVNYYLYTKDYNEARRAVNACRKNLNEMKSEYKQKFGGSNRYLYCHLDENELEGYLLACGVSEAPVTLTEKLNNSQLNQYEGIVEIFKEDNHKREISLVDRRIIELDIEGATSQGILKESKNLEMEIAALNVVRSIFEESNIFASVNYFEKYKNYNCFTAIADATIDVLPYCTLGERNKIKEFLIDCIAKTNNGKKFIKQIESIELFHPLEIEDLKNQVTEEELFIPSLASQSYWKCSSKNSKIEIGTLERQLISCTSANAVRKYLVKLASTNPKKPLWTVNPSWQTPVPINSILMSLQRGFFQDFAYVLVGKARELTAKRDYLGAISMLAVLKSETQRPDISSSVAIAKLGKLVQWEILLVQITQGLEEWNKKSLDHQAIASRCKECLSSLQNGDNIIEHCAMMLLNYNDWSSVTFLDKRLPSLELPITVASTFLEMEKLKGNKKICRDAWDIVLDMFSNTYNKKSGGGGSGTGGGGGNSGSCNSGNSPGLQITNSLHPFLKKIRDQLVFALTISLLAKIHNILKDDANFDINGEYMYLWPTNISNPIGYNVRSVSETLNWCLREALKYYPQNTGWLRLKGDLELSIGNNEAAMRCYVNSIITGTEYCSLQLQRNIIDDYIIRKMIKCCSNLGCHVQAAVLCQFLEEIDYGLAFKNLSEKSCNFTDAMDAYYCCIWDATILEFIINLHSKKGEHNRKLEAISIIGNLELNANNNEEVKRESAAVRKTRFLRALAKQYLP